MNLICTVIYNLNGVFNNLLKYKDKMLIWLMIQMQAMH